MNREQLMEYLHKLILLEKDIHTYQSIRFPTYATKEHILKPSKRSPSFFPKNEFLNALGLIVCGLSLIIYLLFDIWWVDYMNGASSHSLTLLQIGIGIFVCSSIFSYAKTNRSVNSYNRDALLDYEDELKYDKEAREKNMMIKQAKNLLETNITSSKELLATLYSANIIHPKYQNFIAICSFYEYFDTERVSTLTGINGAYNVFENEIRLNHIVTKLDQIVEQLNSLQHNQYELFNAINESNQISESISTKLTSSSANIETITKSVTYREYLDRINSTNYNARVFINNI